MAIYSAVTGRSIDDLCKAYEGKGYGDFKSDLAEAVMTAVIPIQQKINEFKLFSKSTNFQIASGDIDSDKNYEMNEKRTNLAMRYQKLLAGVKGISIPKEVSYSHKHVWHLYTILVESEKTGISRDDFMEQLKTIFRRVKLIMCGTILS